MSRSAVALVAHPCHANMSEATTTGKKTEADNVEPDRRASERQGQGVDQTTKFVDLLTSHQRDLYSYIDTLLVGDSSASDVLQDTNLALWSHLADFDFSRPFLPWAYAFAFQRVLAFRKTRSRSRLVFSDEVLEWISDVYTADSTAADDRLGALKQCLEKLTSKEGELVRERYAEKMSVKMLASRSGRSANQVSVHLYRIRHALGKCVEATLALEG